MIIETEPRRERLPVTIVEPGGASARSGEQIGVARDEAGIDVIVGSLHFRIMQARLVEPRVCFRLLISAT
jgi:hypothetical protein